MLDHVFTDAIGALRDAFETARLERKAFEERFWADVLLGDLNWQTTYGLPGEGMPPRVQADVSCSWPTWSQTAYRSWYVTEELSEPPRIEIEIVLRIQRLAMIPDPTAVLAVLPVRSPSIGGEKLTRSGPTVESSYGCRTEDVEHAIEVSYEGAYELDEPRLADGSMLDDHFNALGGWISSTLVRLGDLNFR
ncbi:MAG: hypothetical protein OXB92_01040 [Acidimicrobiaceae bacterium]|nr:hypothetical protein [Acidimicrobiia bacterium]MCY4492427.1 hypothetical protein [Acidimicrobiaceae bacterium]